MLGPFAIALPFLAVLADDDEEPADLHELLQRAVMFENPRLFSTPFLKVFNTASKQQKDQIYEDLFFLMFRSCNAMERKVIADALVRASLARPKNPMMSEKTSRLRVDLHWWTGSPSRPYLDDRGGISYLKAGLDHNDRMGWFDSRDPESWKDLVTISEITKNDTSINTRKRLRFLWVLLYALFSGAIENRLKIEWSHFNEEDPSEDFLYFEIEITRRDQHYSTMVHLNPNVVIWVDDITIRSFVDDVKATYERTLTC